jgi:energy-coupling factor transport system permease protein
MQDAFSARHPLIGFIYFTVVILFSMFLMHPVCLMISLLWCIHLFAVPEREKSAALFFVGDGTSAVGDGAAQSAF